MVVKEPDFSGYATKAGLKCSDGRTIMPNAFEHQDKMTVPLVWQHGHSEPGNVLGHAILENRADGVYTYGYFNETPQGQSSKQLVEHGDVTFLSIYANQLVEKAKQVFHGAIREVSLVLAGANPGAKIDYVAVQHGDGEVVELEDEAVIYTGLTLEHADKGAVPPQFLKKNDSAKTEDAADDDEDGETVQDVYNTLSEKQKEVVHFMIGAALEGASAEHADMSEAVMADDATIEEVYNSFSDTQKEVVHFMIGAALEGVSAEHSDESDAVSADDLSSTNNEGNLNHTEGSDMTRNVFEQNGLKQDDRPSLSHDQLKTIVEDAQKLGSFKEAFLEHAQEYGIENIDILFPDARSLSNTPDVIGRRQEWVTDVINGTKHSPFARIKSTAVDLTADEARAKGYVKGNLKKEEIIKLLKRVTTPTTVYKKQKLDRDDIIDITDLDVVAWLKAEMRLMLDEELARAVLLGDGREADDEDAIDVDHIRPIAYDNDMYAHSVVVASEVSGEAVIESILRTRTYYKGTGTPTLYTTDALLTDLLLLKDKVGRRLYETDVALAAALRVAKIVPVEVMNDNPDIVAIVVNLTDYTLGADKGGNISMFDDFDIDYNQYKYLIETRVSGALTKPKSAIVVKRTLGTVVSPTTPSYNGSTHTITFPSITGVIYSVEGVTKSGSLVIEETTDVEARPATGYSFPPNTARDWSYVYNA